MRLKPVRSPREIGGENSGLDNHYFGGFYEGGHGLAFLQTHFAYRIGRDNRCDVLPADGEAYLSHQPAHFDIGDAPDQLVPAADPAKIGAPSRDISSFRRPIEETVDFLFRNPMVAACRLDGADLPLVDPLLQRGIADAQHLGSLTRRKELWMDHSEVSLSLQVDVVKPGPGAGAAARDFTFDSRSQSPLLG